MKDWLSNLRSNERVSTVASYLLVSGMVACLMVTLIQVRMAFSPQVKLGYLVLLGFLISLEVQYLQRLRQDVEYIGVSWFTLYFSEAVVWLVVLKVIQLLSGGLQGIAAEWKAWRLDFLPTFFAPDFLFGAVALFSVWVVCLLFAIPLEVLRVTPRRLQIETETADPKERSVARSHLVDRILLVGVIMVILTSLMRYELAARWLGISPTRQGVANILVYFLFALILLSLTQFTSLQMRWSLNRIPIDPAVARHWIVYSLVFLVALAVFVYLLPTRYGMGVLQVLRWLLSVLLLVGNLLIWLVSLPLFIFAALMAKLMGQPTEDASSPPLPLPTPQPQASPQEPVVGLDLIRTIVFLVVLGVLVIYLILGLYQRARLQRPWSVKGLFGRDLPAGLSRLWSWFWGWLAGFNSQVTDLIGEGLQRFQRRRSPRPQPPPWRYNSLRRMSNRQKVHFYYMALVHRGSESGLRRHPSQTPYEYALSLSRGLDQSRAGSLDDFGEDITSITERFIEARYSQHVITMDQVEAAETSWQRLKRAIARLRKGMAKDA